MRINLGNKRSQAKFKPSYPVSVQKQTGTEQKEKENDWSKTAQFQNQNMPSRYLSIYNSICLCFDSHEHSIDQHTNAFEARWITRTLKSNSKTEYTFADVIFIVVLG